MAGQKHLLKDLLKSDQSLYSRGSIIRDGEDALHTLSEALLGADYRSTISSAFPELKFRYSINNSVTLGLVPLDFYAWGLWKPNDDIACCIAGTPSENTFHSLARSRLRERSDLITIERGDKSEATFNLQIGAIKIQLRYHQNPLISRWAGIRKADLTEVKANLPWHTKERIEELVKTQEVAEQLCLHGIETVRSSYFLYRRWADTLGFYPGALKREQILVLAIYGFYADITKDDLQTLNLPLPENTEDVMKTADELSLKITKIRPPVWQTIENIVKSFDRLNQKPQSRLRSADWPLLLQSFPDFIRVDVSYWGSSRTNSAKFLQAVERALRFGLLKDLRKSFPSAAFHLSPYPLREDKDSPSATILSTQTDHVPPVAPRPYAESEEESQQRTGFELSYFIGFDRDSPGLDNEALNSDFCYKSFSDAYQGEEDSYTFWQLSSISQKNIVTNCVEFIPWPIPIPEDVRKLALDEDEEATERSPSPPQSKAKKSKSKNKSKTSESVEVPPQSSIFLRPAADVLHRIRHDISFKTDDYLIGYLDRHTGIKEIPFDWWTAENTAEEFIPQSRIRYFKRKSDCVVVWDREARIDLVFCTGKHES